MQRNILGALVSMLLGGLLMVQVVVALNKAVDQKEEAAKKQTSIVKMKKTKKQVVKKEEPKPRAKRRAEASAKVRPPVLSAAFGGLAMNIPEFAVADIEGDPRELLDHVAMDVIMTEETADSKPTATYKAPIEYPSAALENGIEGYVVMHLLIGKDGSIELAKVLESEPEGIFEDSVLGHIQDWRFAPAKYKGESVAVWVKQKVRFNL
jgi:protein TonB